MLKIKKSSLPSFLLGKTLKLDYKIGHAILIYMDSHLKLREQSL